MNRSKSDQTRRRFLRATGGAAAVILAGCSSGNEDNNSSKNYNNKNSKNGGGGVEKNQQSPIEGDSSKTFRQVSGTISSLDPIAANDTESNEVTQQIFDGLMNYPNGKATVDSNLAKDYEIKNKKTYVFKLKHAEFHNGDPITAQDFVYSWERLAQSDNSKQASSILEGGVNIKHETRTKDGSKAYKPNSLAVKAINKKTLQVTLESPYHATLESFANPEFAVVPKNIVGDIKGTSGKIDYKKFANDPVGSGPFKFKGYEPGTEVIVDKFDSYHDDKATIANVHWQIIPKTQAQYQYSQGKNTDIVSIPTAQYDTDKITIKRGPDNQNRKFGSYGPLKNGETANYMRIPALNTNYLGMNMTKVPKPARQAFAYVANQKQFVDQIFKNRGKAAHLLTPPAIYPGGAKAYEQHAKQNYPYGYNKIQISEAKKVMKKAGYGPNNRLTITWTQTQLASFLKLGKQFRDRLQAAYIDLKIEQADFATMLERGRNGKLEVYALKVAASEPNPDTFLEYLNPPETDTSKSAPVSYLNWNSDTGDAAEEAEKAYQTIQENQAPTKEAEKARKDSYIDLENSNWKDVAILPLYHGIIERFSYQWARIPPVGAMGTHNQMYDKVKIAEQRN